MIITREADYALRTLRALSSGNKMNVTEICAQEIVPKQFAYKILRRLNRGGLVHTIRGVEGGYILDVDLYKVSMFDVIEVMEMNPFLNACMDPGYQCEWAQKHQKECVVHNKIAEVQEKLKKELQEVNMGELLLGPRN